MGIFRRGSTYHYDFILDGERHQGSTKLKNKKAAENLVNKIRDRLVNESRGFKFVPEIEYERPIPRFREQAEVWLTHLRTRNRKPIPDSSVPTIRGALNKWLLPALGSLRLSEVNHTALRELVQKMSDAGLAAKTIGTYTVMAKQIVESLADDDGQPIVPRKWDNDRIDLPIVNKREQRRVSLTAIQIETLIAVCEEEWERVLYILACASGLRISEALALDREHLSDDCSVIYVRQQVKANKIVACLKTDALGVTWTLILESLRFSVSTWAFALACYFRRGPIRRARTRIPITVASGRSLRSSVFMSQERELIASADSALPS